MVVAPTLLPGVGPIALTVTGVLSLASGIWVARSLRPREEEARLRSSVWWPAWIAPLVGTALLLVDWVRGGVAPRWALNGDMVWNTAQSLFIHSDGGVQSAIHPNPAPLTNLLFAIGYGPGNDPSLGWVFDVHAGVIVLLAAASSLVSGLYVARRSAALHPFVRACLVIAVAWLPYTGGLLGGVVMLGHANALTSYLALWLGWVVFSEPTLRALQKVALLLLLSTVIASSWAPLTVVPVALGVLAAVFALRDWRKYRVGSTKDLVVAGAAFVQLAAYALLVTLPDLRRDGGGLKSDGAVIMVGPLFMLMVMALIVLVAIVTGLWKPRSEMLRENREVALGVGVVLLFSAPVFAYMLLQRAGQPTLWGYYPVKFITLLAMVLAGVLIASVASMISPRAGWAKQALAALIAVPLFVSVLAPAFLAGQRWGAFSPSIVLSQSGDVQADAAATKELIRIFDERQFSAQVAVEVAGDSGWESLINNYLIQLSAEGSRDQIRVYAYTLNTQDPQQMCDMIALWDEEVTVWTVPERVEPLTAQLGECPAASTVSVEVAPTE